MAPNDPLHRAARVSMFPLPHLHHLLGILAIAPSSQTLKAPGSVPSSPQPCAGSQSARGLSSSGRICGDRGGVGSCEVKGGRKILRWQGGTRAMCSTATSSWKTTTPMCPMRPHATRRSASSRSSFAASATSRDPSLTGDILG